MLIEQGQHLDEVSLQQPQVMLCWGGARILQYHAVGVGIKCKDFAIQDLHISVGIQPSWSQQYSEHDGRQRYLPEGGFH